MKKKLIFALWILLFFGFVLVNCNAQSSTNDQRIVGTWVNTGKSDDIDYTITYVFNANGSGTWTSTHPYDSPKNGTFTYGFSVTGEIISDGVGYSPRGKIYFSPDGRTMLIDNTFYRKK